MAKYCQKLILMSIFCQFSSLTSSIYWQIQYKTKKLKTSIFWKPYVRFPSNKNYKDQCTKSNMTNLFKWSYSQFLFSLNIVSNLLNCSFAISVSCAVMRFDTVYEHIKYTQYHILFHQVFWTWAMGEPLIVHGLKISWCSEWPLARGRGHSLKNGVYECAAQKTPLSHSPGRSQDISAFFSSQDLTFTPAPQISTNPKLKSPKISKEISSKASNWAKMWFTWLHFVNTIQFTRIPNSAVVHSQVPVFGPLGCTPLPKWKFYRGYHVCECIRLKKKKKKKKIRKSGNEELIILLLTQHTPCR